MKIDDIRLYIYILNNDFVINYFDRRATVLFSGILKDCDRFIS